MKFQSVLVHHLLTRNLATRDSYVTKTSLPLHASAICNCVYFGIDGTLHLEVKKKVQRKKTLLTEEWNI